MYNVHAVLFVYAYPLLTVAAIPDAIIGHVQERRRPTDQTVALNCMFGLLRKVSRGATTGRVGGNCTVSV